MENKTKVDVEKNEKDQKVSDGIDTTMGVIKLIAAIVCIAIGLSVLL